MRVQHATIGRGAHVRLARRPVGVVTDSACDLSEEVIRAHGIHVVPMSLVDDDRTYRDGIDITASEFHDKLAAAGALPTTSQPSPASFLEAYERAGEEAESIVGIFVASTLSGTVGAAEVAASRVDGVPVRVADSLGASLLQGLLVLKAAELGELGWEAGAIVDELTRIRSRSGILFTVRTFDRLIASGRVSLGKALIGRYLGIKPILGLTGEGRVKAFGKAFGDRRARPELMRILRARVPRDAKVRFGVVHVGLPEIVDPVSAELRAAYGKHVEILSAPATPVISTHLGIGAWGVAYLVEE
jgi:DegV family protein with EDD domain